MQDVLNVQAQEGDFRAFSVEDDSIDRKVAKVNFSESDDLMQLGRIAIKNRIKPFRIEVTKHNLPFNSFKIEVSFSESRIKQAADRLQQFHMTGTKLQIPV